MTIFLGGGGGRGDINHILSMMGLHCNTYCYLENIYRYEYNCSYHHYVYNAIKLYEQFVVLVLHWLSVQVWSLHQIHSYYIPYYCTSSKLIKNCLHAIFGNCSMILRIVQPLGLVNSEFSFLDLSLNYLKKSI